MPAPKGHPRYGGRQKGSKNKRPGKTAVVEQVLRAAPLATVEAAKGTIEEFRAFFAPRMPSLLSVLEAVAAKGDTQAMRLLMDRQYGPAATQSVKVSSENESGRFVIEVETTPPSQE